jgi:hypothetical protein
MPISRQVRDQLGTYRTVCAGCCVANPAMPSLNMPNHSDILFLGAATGCATAPALRCPLSGCQIGSVQEAVLAADGFTYGRSAISAWLEHSAVSPVTGAPLPNKLLLAVPNTMAKEASMNALAKQAVHDTTQVTAGETGTCGGVVFVKPTHCCTAMQAGPEPRRHGNRQSTPAGPRPLKLADTACSRSARHVAAQTTESARGSRGQCQPARGQRGRHRWLHRGAGRLWRRPTLADPNRQAQDRVASCGRSPLGPVDPPPWPCPGTSSIGATMARLDREGLREGYRPATLTRRCHSCTSLRPALVRALHGKAPTIAAVPRLQRHHEAAGIIPRGAIPQ